MIENYLSKIGLAIRVSRNWGTFTRLLVNSKKYSHYLKNHASKTEALTADEYNLEIAGKKFDIRMRTYSGDISIFYELFWKKMYSIPSHFVQSPETIVDLGAHVGFASIFYATEFPAAKIYSVEASRENFKYLKRNTEQFENIIALNNAIYPTDGEVLFDESGFSYNTKIGEGGQPMSSVSMKTLMNNYGVERINLLKIDIEGAEKELLGENNGWLEWVDNIIIELHRPYNMNDLERDLAPYGFKIMIPDVENNLKNIFAYKA